MRDGVLQQRVQCHDFLVLVNGWWEPLEFTIPDCRPGLAWRAVIDTYDPAILQPPPLRQAGDRVTTGPRSVLVLRGPRAGPGTFMTHLAVQEADDDGQTTYWGEHVTDDEYRGA